MKIPEGASNDDAEAWLAETRLTLARPAGYEPREIREWVDQLCFRFGLTPTELSRKAGVVPSTLNRFLSSKQIGPNLSGSTIAKIGRAVVSLVDQADEIAKAQLFEKINRGDPPDLMTVHVCGHVDHLPGPPFWPSEKHYKLRVPNLAMSVNKGCFGYEIRGNVADLVYPSGSIVFGISFTELTRGPKVGENIIACAPYPTADSVLYTIGRHTVDASGHPWLTFLTSDPKAPEKIPTGRTGALQDPAILIIGSFRPEH